MAYEAITVRMSRSNTGIPWGFQLRSAGSAIQVASVDRDSLADKAGLLVSDTVTALLGRSAIGMNLSQAQNMMHTAREHLDLALQRELNEQDNQIVVDRITTRPSFPMQPSLPLSTFPAQSRSSSYNYSSTQSNTNTKTTTTKNVPILMEPSPFLNQQSSAIPLSYNTSTTTQYNNTSSSAPFTTAIPISNTANYNNNNYNNNRSSSSYQQNQTQPVHYGTTGNLNTTSSTAPFVHTDYNQQKITPQNSPRYSAGSSPRGRVTRELSPRASIRHLQYNSPMNLYSPRSAAEAYLMQTGGFPKLLRQQQNAAMLNSETRRLIAEHDNAAYRQRSASPIAQSASFKRISSACGTPVN